MWPISAGLENTIQIKDILQLIRHCQEGFCDSNGTPKVHLRPCQIFMMRILMLYIKKNVFH